MSGTFFTDARLPVLRMALRMVAGDPWGVPWADIDAAWATFESMEQARHDGTVHEDELRSLVESEAGRRVLAVTQLLDFVMARHVAHSVEELRAVVMRAEARDRLRVVR